MAEAAQMPRHVHMTEAEYQGHAPEPTLIRVLREYVRHLCPPGDAGPANKEDEEIYMDAGTLLRKLEKRAAVPIPVVFGAGTYRTVAYEKTGRECHLAIVGDDLSGETRAWDGDTARTIKVQWRPDGTAPACHRDWFITGLYMPQSRSQ